MAFLRELLLLERALAERARVVLRTFAAARLFDDAFPRAPLPDPDLFFVELDGINVTPLYLKYFRHSASRGTGARPANRFRGCPDLESIEHVYELSQSPILSTVKPERNTRQLQHIVIFHLVF